MPLRHSLPEVHADIINCHRCPRLRTYCQEVGRMKRAAYRHEQYWAKPVPGFGDPGARVLVLGLAPAAHGANRTGRVFTGDGQGGSGDFLMAALHRAGFASRPTSERSDDGLILTGVYVTAAVRCAPPANKPSTEEIEACLGHLAAEARFLPRVQVVVALGRIAWDAWLTLLVREGVDIPRPKPKFAHGAVCAFPAPSTPPAGALALAGRTLIGCYHPSRQNTNTGRVTAAMYDALFQRI